jgi:predicted dehydrogenase
LSNYKIAIVGAGNMASEHIRAFLDIADVDIVAITSRNLDRANGLAAKYSVGSVCSTISEIYQKHQPDGLIVAVSELETHGVLTDAGRFPWSILAEKPVGYNYEEAMKIFSAVERRQDSIFVALNRRHYSSTREVLNQVSAESGVRVVVVNDQEDPESALADRRPLTIVKNWMYANSIHLIDYFTIFCRGELQHVKNIVPWRGMETEFMLSELEYSSGDRGVYLSYWNRPHPWSVSISSKDKWWELRPIESAAAVSRQSRTPVLTEKSKWDLDFKPGLRLQAEEFVRHLKKQAHSLPTIRQSLSTMELVSKLYEA